jgi:guanylate kinase
LKLNDLGLLVVISGPSGVGKSTVRKALFNIPNHNFVYSISMTTRKPRACEENGVDYFFVSEDEFKEKIKEDDFLEYTNFVGNYYGTPKSMVLDSIKEGKEVILEIEVDGASQVRKHFKNAVYIFLVPPTRQQLIDRIKSRKSETNEVMLERLEKAKAEFQLAYKYDYIVVNDNVDNAADRIMAIIRAEHAKTERSIYKYDKILNGDI